MMRFLTSGMTGRTCSSRRITVFGTYNGASVMILRTLDWNISRISLLDVDAIPHSCTPYVDMGELHLSWYNPLGLLFLGFCVNC
jgi:hypothetical protein